MISVTWDQVCSEETPDPAARGIHPDKILKKKRSVGGKALNN